jgi:hypothetical protein
LNFTLRQKNPSLFSRDLTSFVGARLVLHWHW